MISPFDDLTKPESPLSGRKRKDSLPPDVALAFVGSVVSDEPAFHNIAFSRAGQMSQQGLLLGLKRAGLPPSLILSMRPIPSFPHARRLWVGKRQTYLPEGIAVSLFPFLNVTPIKQMSIGLATVWRLLCWGWRMRHKQYRVVYTFNLSVPPGLFTLLAARLIGAKAMVSLNDINEPGQTVPPTLVNRVDFWLHKWLVPRFDGHVVVSDLIMDDFAPGRPYIRIEGGIRSEILDRTSDTFKPKKEKNAPFVIVSAGSLDEANGVLILLEAFTLLAGEQYRLHIAGRGPLEKYVEEAAKKDHRIEYVGFVSFEEVLRLYNSADVLINMRLTKALNTGYFFPSKVMECLASGVPLITTCTGHAEEEFGDFCYLLKDETPQGLANIIRCVASLDPHERAEIAHKARVYVAVNKTWDAQSRKIVKFICGTVLKMDLNHEFAENIR